MNGLIEFVKTIGAARLAAMGAVAVGLLGFFIFIMVRFSEPTMTVLFSDLSFEDSSAIVQKLEELDVHHEVRQQGAIILVPEERVLKLRMSLAEGGLPAGGVVGYEIFDKGDTLGATSFLQNINRVRALEGELARTIRSLDRVRVARVHLVLPQRQLFSRQAAEPSASIVLKVRGQLDRSQIKAIQNLAASAVPNLKPGRVSIVNDRGKLLASGRGDETGGASVMAIDERSAAFENRLQSEIEEIIASIVGPGRARVRVSAEMDYSKITKTSEIYDPDSRVVRSTQTREESSASAHPNGSDAVSVGNELPSADKRDGGDTSQRESASKTEETVNYEISRTSQTEVLEAGRIKRISVAVLVDGTYGKGPDGKILYTPRPAGDLEQLDTLVKGAIGFDAARGDQVQIANLRFADPFGATMAEPSEASMLSMERDDYYRIAELAVLLIVSLLVLFFAVRPLIRRIITPEIAKTVVAVAESAEAAETSAEDEQLSLPSSAETAALEAAAAHSKTWFIS